jgi:phage terminase small subunit
MESPRLTVKQDKFLKRYMETGNGTEAALEVYDTDNENTAAVIASQNLRKPSILEKFREAQGIAHSTIVSLAVGAENEAVRLNAAKDIIDRTEGKAMQRTDVTSGGARITAGFTDEEKEALLNLLK